MIYDDRDDDAPLEDDLDDTGDADVSETLPCPACGCPVYEDAVQCPSCGDYIIHPGSSVWRGRPLWWIALGGLGIAALLAWLLAP